jgi:hypothetical protein
MTGVVSLFVVIGEFPSVCLFFSEELDDPPCGEGNETFDTILLKQQRQQITLFNLIPSNKNVSQRSPILLGPFLFYEL